VPFGGISPYVATWLIQKTGNPQAPAFYLMGIAALSLVATLIVRETKTRGRADGLLE